MQTYTIEKVSFEQLKALLEGNGEYSIILQNIAIYTSDKELIAITHGLTADRALNTTEIWPKVLETTEPSYASLKAGVLNFNLGNDELRFKLR